MTLIQLLFSGKGRIRRRDYWLTTICMGITSLLIEFGGHHFITGRPASDFFTDLSTFSPLKPEPFTYFLLAMMVIWQWPAMCIAIKRWHDRGRSGWLSLISPFTSLVQLVGQIYYGPLSGHPNLAIYFGSSLLMMPLVIWVFVECGCLDGTKGPNPYGPSPKGIQGPSSVF